MVKNVVFVCGAGGDAGMTYVSELEKFCKSNGWKFYAPHMPGFVDGITYKKYEISFEEVCKNIDLSDTLIIAQSVGTNFVVKYFSDKKSPLAGYISVSGFSSELDKDVSKEVTERLKCLDGFKPNQEQFNIFKNLDFPKFSIYGGKDCFFTTKNLDDYANLIGSKKYFDKNGVHCTISENVRKHELLHKVIEDNFIN